MSAGNIRSLFTRLGRARVWVLLQFALTLVLLLIALAWTRLPDKHIWQVALSLLIPLLLVISMLELQAGTMRALTTQPGTRVGEDGRRVKLVWGAVALLVWVAIGAAFWALLDWCDDQIPLWAGYLNSKTSAHVRASLLTYEHIARALSVAEWILRWIVVPAKLIPFGVASAQWAWRIPLGRTLRVMWNWRWWLGVVAAALVGVLLPAQFFNAPPKGTVTAQEWTVGLKLAGAYLLAVGSWVMLLGWYAALFAPPVEPPMEPPMEDALVAVPVLSGPPDRSARAKADLPPPE